MTKVIRAKLSNYFFAWLAISIILGWFWESYKLNQDTYFSISFGMLSITLILYLVRKNKIQKDESIVAKIGIYFVIWIGIESGNTHSISVDDETKRGSIAATGLNGI